MVNATTIKQMVNETDSPVELVKNVNSYLVNDTLGVMFLVGLSVIMFLGFYYRSGKVLKSFQATTYLSFILAVFLGILGMVPNIVLYSTLLLAGISLALTYIVE